MGTAFDGAGGGGRVFGLSNLSKNRNCTTFQLRDPGQVISPFCTSVASSVKWGHGTVVKIKWVNPAPTT